MIISQITKQIESTGILVGLPCAVIFCGNDNKEVSHDEILKVLQDKFNNFYRLKITGEEPLQQTDIAQFCSVISKEGYYFNIETNGLSFNNEVFRLADQITIVIQKPSQETINNDVLEKILAKYDYKTQIIAIIKDKENLKTIIDTYERIKFKKRISLDLSLVPHWEEKNKTLDKTIIKKMEETLLSKRLDIRLMIPQDMFVWVNKKQNNEQTQV